MWKKMFQIASLCILCTLALNFAACGKDPKKTDYNGVTYDQLESSSRRLADSLMGLTDEEIASMKQSSDEITVNLMTKWEALKPLLGEYKGLGSFSVEKSGKTLTTMQTLNFTGRNVTLTCVYKYLDMQITDITLDEIYTLGEKMQKAGMNTLLGMGTVFSILIMISLIIWGFKVIPYLQQKAAAKKQPQMPEIPARAAEIKALTDAVQLAAQQQAQGRMDAQRQDDRELIAVIAAAIAAAAGTSADGFVVRSIKRRGYKKKES